MKILVITNIFPTAKNPDSGTYVADQINSIKPFAAVKIVSKSTTSRIGFVYFALKTILALLSEKYEVIHAHYGFHSALLAMLFRRQPLIVTFHGSDALIEPDRNRLYHFLQKQVVSYASRLIAVSKQIESRLVNGLSASAEKVNIIPCGVDTGRFRFHPKPEARKKLGLKNNSRVALFIGRLTYAKGVDLIEQAARHLRDVDFYFIGEGPLRWQTANCFFIGLIEHARIPQWLNAADVLLLPSRSEGTPVTVLESLASETPVICSSVGACPELVSDRTTGLLIPVGDAQVLVEAIQLAFSGMSFDMSQARQMVVQNYDLKLIAVKLQALYSQVVQKRMG